LIWHDVPRCGKEECLGFVPPHLLIVFKNPNDHGSTEINRIKITNMRKLDVVEFLKGYAIFTIIIFHYLQALKLPVPFSELIFFGGTGVHLFVLLSGFGLYRSYLKKPIPYTLYLKKRTGKIYFPYIVLVLISAFISLFIPIYENSLYAFGGHVFLYKMFDESIMGSYGYPLWFISTILQFYIAFYAIVFLAKRFSYKYFLLICLVLSIAWTFLVVAIGKEPERVWNSFFLRYLWEFALGMVIAAKLKENNYHLAFKTKTIWFLIIGLLNCAVYAFLAMQGGNIGKMLNDIPALIGYSSIAIYIYMMNIEMINRFFLFTGRISYALYLVHFLVLLLALHVLKMLPEVAVISLALLVTYLLAFTYQKAISGSEGRVLATRSTS
jgi:peptidoglycan/LPS O-acetylase OafA/YrhL